MQQDAARTIVDALDHELRRRKRGIFTKIGDLMGSDRGWWSRRRRSGDLKISELMAVLRFIDLDPIRFLRRTFQNGSLELDFERPNTEQPKIVRRALERLAQKDSEGTLGESFVETLDSIRYEKPHEALKQAEWAVEHLEVRFFPHFLSVLGSIFRHLIRLNDAEHALFTGIEIASQAEESLLVAELIQRLAYVAADRGEYDNALTISESAMVAYLRCGNSGDAARTLYDQGLWLHYLGMYETSKEIAKVSLEWLPKTKKVNISATHHLLAMNWQALGNPQAALRCLQEANRSAETNASLVQDKIQWLMANIQADLGNFEEAEILLTDVFERFCEYKNGDDALLICDLVTIKLRRGKVDEAFQMATEMLKLLEPMRNDKIVSAVIADLLRQGKKGLSLALVKRAKARIESELRATVNAQRAS